MDGMFSYNFSEYQSFKILALPMLMFKKKITWKEEAENGAATCSFMEWL